MIWHVEMAIFRLVAIGKCIVQLFAAITEWLFSNISPFSFPMMEKKQKI